MLSTPFRRFMWIYLLPWALSSLICFWWIIPPLMQFYTETISPIYSIDRIEVIRSGDDLLITGEATKKENCFVIPLSRPSFDTDLGTSFSLHRPEDGDEVQGRPSYQLGDKFPVGPFIVHLNDREAEEARTGEIVLHCKRLGLFAVRASIGPVPIPAATN